MPIIKSSSNKARSENIKTEIEAGKPPAQAAAIGYATQRAAKGQDTVVVDNVIHGRPAGAKTGHNSAGKK